MTPEELDAIRERVDNPMVFVLTASADAQDHRMATYANTATDYLADLLDEVDRLNAELIEARLSAEEAWAAYDEEETP